MLYGFFLIFKVQNIFKMKAQVIYKDIITQFANIFKIKDKIVYDNWNELNA